VWVPTRSSTAFGGAALVAGATEGRYAAQPAHVFTLEQIVEAHRLMESGLARGKIVVRVA
jgi:NADPH:quinone reductase-like Zn-dependent oxidoreductase